MKSEPYSCIHIGLPKTATTMLQRNLFAKHSQIYFLGRSNVMGEEYRRCRDARTLSIIEDAIWAEPSKPDLNLCRKRYEEIRRTASEHQAIPLFSMETLSLNTRGWREIRASNLRKIFGRCKIVITLRHPFELVRSVYSQYIKRELISAKSGKANRLLDINQWITDGFQRSHDPPTCHLDYAHTIRIYANQFGKEAVYPTMFEELEQNRSHYVSSLCRFLGIDDTEGLRLTEKKGANPRLSQANMEALRSIARSPLKSIRFRFAKPPKRMQMIGMTDADDLTPGNKAKERIDRELIEELKKRTCLGNRMLMREWRIPLEEYGYPL
jgi:hypothetical protein